MNYQQAWEFLDNLQFFKIKLGLDSMRLFLDRLGSPQDTLKYIHVAGTNGKGSVCSTIVSVLSEGGYRAGFYSSPHLSSVRERFKINHSYIDEESFARLSSKIVDVLHGDQITYFEFTTALAFLWFAEKNVDVAVMEVGMGGRLDATNVITPLVSVITNISLDHQDYLGDTIAEIAKEKAGIIKENIPVVTGDISGDAHGVISEICIRNKVKHYQWHKDFSCKQIDTKKITYSGIHDSLTDIELKLPGEYQKENCSIALAVCEILRAKNFVISDDSIKNGVKNVQWPGRLERIEVSDSKGQNKRFLLDGAHNEAGVKALLNTISHENSYKRLILIWASMSDKDFSLNLNMILPLADTVIFTMPDENRSATVEQLKDAIQDNQHQNIISYKKVNDAIKEGLKIADPDDLICVAGSLYLVGYARLFLCGEIVDD